MQKSVSTRREFLQKGLVVLSATPTIPMFLSNTAWAMSDPLDTKRTQQPTGKDGKILVVVQLAGGNDGLNTVVPYADAAYHRARPAIGLDEKSVLKIDNYVGLHQNLAPIKELYDDGMMSIVQGVGYPNPNRSHFRSMDIWQSAEPERDVPLNGWIGRYFDNACPGCDPHIGVSIGEQLPLAMRGERVTPLSFDRPENYRYNGKDRVAYEMLNDIDNTSAKPPAPGAATQPVRSTKSTPKIEISSAQQLDFLERTALDAQMSSDEIIRITRSHNSPKPYPNGDFGNGLRTVAAMIAGGLPTRVYYVTLGGFDTHAAQKGRHDQLMQQFAQGVNAFWADLKQQKNADRVMMMSFSEFGRRVTQNASQGTDHGAAAPMFLFGPALKQGLVGKHPSLTDLDQGDLKYAIDFRCIYATVLQSWMDTPSKPILGKQFQIAPIIKA